ncbi:MAG: sulfurtransferase-like selenium metabolism protein YedF [Treponema sp.]|nr:sulfurtransferase-like selenium metabolism protein YedF [Treponema sp.]
MTTINMIGKPCPIPVVEAKKALSQADAQGVIVLADNIIAVQNLEKMAKGLGYSFSHKQKGEAEYAVTISKTGQAAVVAAEEPQVKTEAAHPVPAAGATVFLFTGDQIGISGEEPGKKLMETFLFSLAQMPDAPKVIILINAAVKMAAEGSNVLENLKILAEHGTDIRSCGQCLTYYGLTNSLAVGKITNMLDIVETLTSSERTITL